MSENAAISVDGVAKEFVLRSAVGTRTLKSAVLGMLKSRAGARFRALDAVSFDVQRGETLGIIGANGAGKSTLLSIIAGTMAPTSGQVRTRGSISSLLELGAGFHPDLTGSENIYLYGAIMGLSRSQMKARFDAIVDFAGIEHYIDQPVKHYSSGMYVRLGFAVAVEVDPDILLIDEVLAVGDSDFQRKCIARMHDFRDRGKTMLIISHDLATIQFISDRILVLQDGRIAGIGAPGSMVSAYQSMARRGDAHGIGREWGTGDARITGVRFLDANGKETTEFAWGSTLVAEIEYETSKRIDDPVFGFAVGNSRGQTIFGNNTQIEGKVIRCIEGRGRISLRIDRLNMATGTYLFSFSLHSADHRVNYHRIDNRFPIAVSCEKPFEGCCYMDTAWTVN